MPPRNQPEMRAEAIDSYLRTAKRRAIILVVLLLACCVGLALDISTGPSFLPLDQVWDALFRPERLDTLLEAAFKVVERHIGVVSIADCEVIRAERF